MGVLLKSELAFVGAETTTGKTPAYADGFPVVRDGDYRAA
jgi:hypothetical protein